MRWIFPLLLALSGMGAPTVQAGPWARAPGEVFLSFSQDMSSSAEALATGTMEVNAYSSIYAELGLGRRLTLGLDLGRGDYTDEAILFLRRTLTRPDARYQVAVDIGYGERRVEVLGDSQLARVGLSFGRGFDAAALNWLPLELTGGWIGLDAVAVYDLTRDEQRWKIEATLGLRPTERVSLMLQVIAEDWPGADVSFGLNPSVVFQIREGTSIELGARTSFDDNPQIGLELGLWHQF
jgi:hypothetical protein